jgi:cytochrome b561
MTTPDRYDPASQAFHWVSAVTVLVAYAVGLLREEFPKGDFRTALLNLHMSVGLLVFALTFLRLVWRTGHPAPPVLPDAPLITLVAKAAHLVLYAAMIAIPLVGLASAWAKGTTVGFFWVLPVPSPIAINKLFADQLEDLHAIAAHVLIAIAGLHALAAIGHHFILKDAALLRMLPARLGMRLQARR